VPDSTMASMNRMVTKNRTRSGRLLHLAIVVIWGVRDAYYYPRLPAIVPKHFGADGIVYSSYPKPWLFCTFWVFDLGTVGVSVILPWLVVTIGAASRRELRHRLVGRRRDRGSFSAAKVERIHGQAAWCGMTLALFVVVMEQMSINASLSETGPWTELIWSLGVILVAACLFVVIKLDRPPWSTWK
jgi:uncharacterized membrane protein